jgi:hypothetical protein
MRDAKVFFSFVIWLQCVNTVSVEPLRQRNTHEKVVKDDIFVLYESYARVVRVHACSYANVGGGDESQVQLLGKFASEVDAARKYDKQALLLGKNLLNFPDEVGLAQSAKKSKARRGSLRYTSPPLAAPAAALRGVQGGSRSDSASPGIRRGSGNIGSSSRCYGYDINNNNSGGRGGTKYHRLGNRDEFDDEEAGLGMPRTQRNRRSGSTSQAPGLGSSLPVDDWLRCKAALKMGRPMWETLGQFQLSAAADARAHNLATQLSQAAPMHATRLGLALQQQQPGLSNSSGGFGTAIGGAGAGMGIDGGNRRSSTRIMRRRTSAIGVPEARSSVAIAEFDALKDHYAIAHGVSAHAFAAAFRREVQQRDDEGQGAGGVSNVTPGKRHSKGGKVRFERLSRTYCRPFFIMHIFS